MPLTDPVNSRTVEGLHGIVLLKEINSGHFGRVYQALEESTRKNWACKIIEKTHLSKRQKDNVKNEVDIMKGLVHPNIIAFQSFQETEQYFVITMELMKGGDLFDRIIVQKTFMMEDARLLMVQMADAISYLHSQGVAHRDLKIENVMFVEPNSNEIKIGDFGLAKRIGSATTRTPVGTQKYMAPEIVKGEFYSFSVDIWSLGCLLFILLYGTFPFFNETDKKGNKLINITDKIKKGYFKFPREGEYKNETVDEEAKDLIRKALEVDPSKRITIKEFREHSWMRTKSTCKTPLNAPAAMRTAEGIVSMRDYFNVGVHAERGRIDGEHEVEDQIAQQKSSLRLGSISQSMILKKRNGHLIPLKS